MLSNLTVIDPSVKAEAIDQVKQKVYRSFKLQLNTG